MKKVLFAAIAVLFLLSSCSKSQSCKCDYGGGYTNVIETAPGQTCDELTEASGVKCVKQ